MGKFQIPTNPPTTNKTIRFPNDVVEQVEQAIQGKKKSIHAPAGSYAETYAKEHNKKFVVE